MATRQTKRQLHFTGLEMTMLGVSFVLTVTVVFFLGLFVGKKNASYHAPAEDRVARIPVDDFTKYKRPEPLAPKVKPAPPGVEVATASGSKDAGVDTAAKDEPAAAATPKATEAAAAAAAVEAKPTSAAKVATDAAAQTDADKAKQIAAKEAADKEAAKKKAEEEAEPATGRGYTVQLLATRKQADADALVRKLKSKGYAAYVKKIADGAGAWYRVRVGSYGAFSDARTMADRCRRDLDLAQAFVSTE